MQSVLAETSGRIDFFRKFKQNCLLKRVGQFFEDRRKPGLLSDFRGAYDL